MPSKGISIYSYISVEGYVVEFYVPGTKLVHTQDDNFTTKDLEIDSSFTHGLLQVGRFEWRVLKNGELIASAHNDISAVTGCVESGTMMATVDFLPIVTEDAIITYGFYIAGSGVAGLTNRHQSYVVISARTNANWMGTVAPPGSAQASKPFSRFVLAAPHDNGMNNMQICDSIFQSADLDTVTDLKKVFPVLSHFDHLPDHILLTKLPNIVYGVAITQKKEVSIMLELGARYFEFRPAKLIPAFRKIANLPDKFYFQHACIPGLAFDEFLKQQVTFLDQHPNEFVVIHIRFDNIVADCQKPTNQEVFDMLTQACSTATRTNLTWGGDECFSQPIDDLRHHGKRLICVILADKYDSWTAQSYATLSAKSILERFESMDTEGQQSTDLTVLQCQATSQSIKEVLVYSVLSANSATSCLTSTKAALDMQTLPWIRKNALDRLKAEKTIVIMNDFIDGATTDTSVILSKQRLAA
ncbi:hypothetical protein BGZ49_006182 [Haplosporangium sp. Z 27]|nr:hypothetical protein BGZ49_006182 [Haplosporangium sp. Z 27]